MNFFLSSILFTFSTFSLSIQLQSTPSFPLLSLKCTPPPFNQTNVHNYTNPLKTLLDNLTSDAPKSHFTTLNTQHYSGLMQCRSGLGPKNCTLCAIKAHNTILNHCQYSNSISAWFDGCYVQIIDYFDSSSSYMQVFNVHSCSNRDDNRDPARFSIALETLLLKLRADINFATHHGFSHGEITYDNFNRGKIYGLVECVRLLSPKECDFCVGEAIEKINFYCGGKNGGIMVHGMCFVRFDSSEFYYGEVHNNSGVFGNFTVLEGENENSGCMGYCKRKMILIYWGGGFCCFVVLVLCVWLLRRTILNRAKVLTFG